MVPQREVQTCTWGQLGGGGGNSRNKAQSVFQGDICEYHLRRIVEWFA
jgi:hypothetical protein